MIERLRLRNFRRYRDATLRFEAGVNIIEGRNNVGKTTLFYAIEYALFGRVENFKTIRSLMQPGKRSLGVELAFAGQNGQRYLLQRVHQMPPKSKKILDGHFTLKEILDDGERYLLASDFGDTEDKLALMMHELTGLTRRLFSVALHMRQGDIPAILDGAKQLDIVLGVTAASIAEDELRQMALELEKESTGLPVLLERERSIAKELARVSEECTTLNTEHKATVDKLKTLGEAPDPRVELERQLQPLSEKLASFDGRSHRTELARQRLADEQQRQAEACVAGSREDVEKELAELEAVEAARANTPEKLRGDLEQANAERRKLDTQRGDLAGRIERRKNLPQGRGAKCEMCGAPIKAADTAKELAAWSAELELLDKTLAACHERQVKLQEALDKETTAERKRHERRAQLAKHREQLSKLDASLAQRQKEYNDAIAAGMQAFAAIQAEAKAVAPALQAAKFEFHWNLDAEPAAALASIREAIQALRQSLAERVGRQIAERKALADLLERFDARIQSLRRRQADLERERAAALAEAGTLRIKASRAERFRTISAGFKELQVQIRTEAATKLAADTIEMHRKLAETDEFESLTIDPAYYSVQVTPRDLGEEVPAGLYEGGGHRLLLGLSFRLAVAQLVEHCPFLLLDEPTYGLDALSREALLDRIGKQSFARQILLVTHQAPSRIPGHRIEVARQGKESIVVE
jgi:exonuclease SbcC